MASIYGAVADADARLPHLLLPSADLLLPTKGSAPSSPLPLSFLQKNARTKSSCMHVTLVALFKHGTAQQCYMHGTPKRVESRG